MQVADIELVFDWLFVCAKLNKQGKCAKILRGEIDYHELFGEVRNDDVFVELPDEAELVDVPGYDGKYKMNIYGDVVSYAISHSPKVLKHMHIDARGGCYEYVCLIPEKGKKNILRVSDVYEMTFGKPMEG